MEKMINRESVLRRTNWGIDIYAFILRKYYPGELVMHVKGRDCGIVRNPFAGGVQTLHIWFSKNDPDARLSDETAYHKDQFGAIPDGDALDFAAMYYNQTGQELLETLNREMYLHLDEGGRQYTNARPENVERGPHFSFYKAPISNTQPFKSITISDAYNFIAGPYAKDVTEKLRAIQDKKRARAFKAANFHYATFSGEFSSRGDDKLLKDSGLLCIDFDHIQDIEGLFNNLLNDSSFETALLFRSPSGEGLKWIIEVNKGNIPHDKFFLAVENYIYTTYGQKIDKTGKDISRACFLCYDPLAYINPNYR